jgi:hypothetical protein
MKCLFSVLHMYCNSGTCWCNIMHANYMSDNKLRAVVNYSCFLAVWLIFSSLLSLKEESIRVRRSPSAIRKNTTEH